MNVVLRKQLIRWMVFFTGIIIMAFGIVLIIKADLGTAPWDVLHIGLTLNLGLTIGIWSIIVGLFILAASSLLTKRLPKIGAFLNMLLVGVFIDIFLYLPIIVTPSVFSWKLGMLLAGIVINGIGIGIYVASDFGVGPRDSLMLALKEVTHFKLQYIRLSMEVIVLFIGWLLGGPVFIGTVIYSVTIGSVVGVALPFFDKLVKRMIARGEKDENFNKRPIRSHNYDGLG